MNNKNKYFSFILIKFYNKKRLIIKFYNKKRLIIKFILFYIYKEN